MQEEFEELFLQVKSTMKIKENGWKHLRQWNEQHFIIKDHRP